MTQASLSGMRISTVLGGCAAALLLWLPAQAAAPVGPEQGGPKVGIIPGTHMTHDEFRGRAQAQLAAIALNAVVFYLGDGSYDPDYIDLTASKAWNLSVTNMFTGKPVQSIYFEPTQDSMTGKAPDEMGMFDPTDIIPDTPPASANPSNGEPGQLTPLAPLEKSTLRVNPHAIRDYSGGDVYYYTKGDLLQLIMFAPDGTFVEWVDEMPNANYREHLLRKPDQPLEDLLAAQVAFYVQDLLPQYYNLVQFMSDKTTQPGAALPDVPVSKRLEWAKAIGVSVRNPVTRQPIQVVDACSPGNLLDTGSPVQICTDAGPKMLADLTITREEYGTPQPKPKPQAKPKPGSPPPGGHTPGAPGGGKRQR